MHIMFIDEYKMVNYTGGIEKVLCHLANALIERGYKVTIVCLDTEHGIPAFYLNKKVKFINLCYDIENNPYKTIKYYVKKGEKEILRTFGGAQMVFKGHRLKDPKKQYFWDEFIKRVRHVMDIRCPDVLICVSIDSTYYIQRAVGHTNIPIISMCHTDVNEVIKNSSQNRLEAWKKSVVVQVLMRSYKDILSSYGIHNVVYIPNFVEQMSKEQQVDLSQCHYKIISVGRVEKIQKRQYLLIQAFAKIASKYPQWTVHIFGEIDNKHYKHELDKLIINKGLKKRVILEGVTYDIPNQLQQSDIFAIPSAYEGFGLALTEAMSVGLPALGYKSCTAVNELIQNNTTGFLCEDGIDDFANKLALLMTNQALRIQMGNCAINFTKQFAPHVIWDSWEKIFKSIEK